MKNKKKTYNHFKYLAEDMKYWYIIVIFEIC